jgi:peptide/nickel transport system permease protein
LSNVSDSSLLLVVRLILSRSVLYLGTLLVVSLFIFAAVEVLPGDTASRILGQQATPETLAVLRDRLGLNVPAYERYWSWLTGIVLRNDWGNSIVSDQPITYLVFPRLRNTLMLAGSVLILYLPVSMILGILTALNHNRGADNVISILALAGMSLPEFVTGFLLLIVFAVTFDLFPALSLLDGSESLPDLVHKLALPVLTLLTVTTAYGLRILRDELIDVFESEYVRMAILKGLPKWQVVFRHALPNSVVPMLNVWGLTAAWLIGGVVVVETVFSYPGLGRLLMNSLGVLDTPVIEAIVLILATTYTLVNLVVDIAAILLNPRLRTT